MSKNFVKDPREVVKPGDIVRVKVLDVDHARKRIALTLRLDDDHSGTAAGGPPAARTAGSGARGGDGRGGGRPERGRPERPGQSERGGRPARPRGGEAETFTGGALADALRRAGLDKGLDKR